MNPRPVLHVAAAIIRRGEEVALVLQGAEGEEPFWGVPGGVVEADELVPEALVREVFEETGLTIQLPARLAYIRQIDNRRPARLRGHSGTGPWLHRDRMALRRRLVGRRDRCARPGRVVHEARFVPAPEAVERLRRTDWLELAADYLEGLVEQGSLHFERWHDDGTVTRADT